VNIKEDVAEEVLRLYGFDNLESKALNLPKTQAHSTTFLLENFLKAKLYNLGYTEIYNYTFVNSGEVKLKAGLAEDKMFLRKSLQTGMQNSFVKNYNYLPIVESNEVKTFEIGRAYRNEGSSPEHLQEFTNMEFYWSFADYNDGMKLVRDMYIKIAKEVFGTTKFTTRGHDFDLGDEWKKIDYIEEIQKQTGIDILTASEKEMAKKLQDLKVNYGGQNKERLIDSLWKYCRKNIAGPAFLINHPTIVAPLAKSVEGKNVVQMFQPIIAGSELGRGYSELNDPIDQKERFETQQKLIDGGDTEAMMADHEFVEMLEHGMPPTCGFGFGERLFAFLADKPLRELQMFPLMRPKSKE
jgi:lysyl-tRNA synthetase class II